MKKIITKLGEEYSNLKISNWRECKEIFDNIDEIK